MKKINKQLVLIIQTEEVKDLVIALTEMAKELEHDILIQKENPNCMSGNEKLPNGKDWTFDYDVFDTKEDHASIANFIDKMK